MTMRDWIDSKEPGGLLMEVVVHHRRRDGGVVIAQALGQIRGARICRRQRRVSGAGALRTFLKLLMIGIQLTSNGSSPFAAVRHHDHVPAGLKNFPSFYGSKPRFILACRGPPRRQMPRIKEDVARHGASSGFQASASHVCGAHQGSRTGRRYWCCRPDRVLNDLTASRVYLRR